MAEFARCVQPGGMLIATGQRDDGVRQMLSAIVGPERWREYSEVIFRRAPRREADARPKDRYQQAFAKAGLRVEERAAPFTVTWADIDEWIRIRWLSLIPADNVNARTRCWRNSRRPVRKRDAARTADLGRGGGSLRDRTNGSVRAAVRVSVVTLPSSG